MSRPEFQVRRATRADNGELAALTREVPMRGSMQVAQERCPDFFAVESMLEAPLHAYVAEADGQVIGCGSYTVRSLRIGGEVRPVGHIGDLRVRPEWRGCGVFSRLARGGFEDATRRTGTAWATTSLLTSNERALQAAGRVWPPVRPLAKARMANVLVPRLRSRGPQSAADWDEVATFLDAHNQHDLGTPWSVARLRAAGIALEDWLVVRRGGDITAVAAWWQPGSVKQVRIDKYGAAEPLRRAWNAWPGTPHIPSAGSCLPIAYGLFARAGDARSARDLRRSLLRRTSAAGIPVLGLLVPAGGPEAAIASGSLRATLDLTVCSVGDAPALDVSHPGIEVALA